MNRSAKQVLQASVFANAVGLVFSAGGAGTAAADPPASTSSFDIVNDTNYDLLFWDYSSTAKYPQSGPNHNDHAKPGQKFHFALFQMEGSRSDKRNKGRTTIVANFHYDTNGADSPAGTATMDIAFDTGGNDAWSSSVNCWASRDRTCGPRPAQPGNQLFPGNVVTFSG